MKKIKCHYCDEGLSKDDGRETLDGKIVCDNCYYDHVFTCCLCGEDDDIKNQHNFVVVFDEDGGVEQTGIYRVTADTYFAQPCVGSGFLYNWALERIADVPQGADADDYPCGHLCLSCQKKVAGKNPKETNRLLEIK